MTGSTLTRPSSYAVPPATTESATMAGGTGAQTVGTSATAGETTAQRDIDAGLTR